MHCVHPGTHTVPHSMDTGVLVPAGIAVSDGAIPHFPHIALRLAT